LSFFRTSLGETPLNPPYKQAFWIERRVNASLGSEHRCFKGTTPAAEARVRISFLLGVGSGPGLPLTCPPYPGPPCSLGPPPSQAPPTPLPFPPLPPPPPPSPAHRFALRYLGPNRWTAFAVSTSKNVHPRSGTARPRIAGIACARGSAGSLAAIHGPCIRRRPIRISAPVLAGLKRSVDLSSVNAGGVAVCGRRLSIACRHRTMPAHRTARGTTHSPPTGGKNLVQASQPHSRRRESNQLFKRQLFAAASGLSQNRPSFCSRPTLL